MRQAIRHGNIGIAVGVVVLALDVYLFVFANISEPAYQAGGLFAMFVGMAVVVGLQERARRRRDRNQ
jgi:hypothetical protein